jgi:hypothetical protein
MKLTAKIQKVPNPINDSFQFKIVRYQKINGMPSNRLIKTIVNVPFNRLKDPFYRAFVWSKVNRALFDLYLQKLMTSSDIKRAKEKFSEFFALMPTRAAVQSVPAVQSKRAAERALLSKYGL